MSAVVDSGKLRTCVISAPFGVDSRPLRNELAARGVESWQASEVLAGSYVRRTIDEAISDADFVCAVIPAGPIDAHVFLELGMAIGKGRPVLLFVAPKADLPLALREQAYARASLADTEALQFHIDAFLKNVTRGHSAWNKGQGVERSSLHTAPVTSALNRLATWERQTLPPPESEMVALLADVFNSAGYATFTESNTTGESTKRADLAVWVDELQIPIGNPLVIEVVRHAHPSNVEVLQLLNLLQEFMVPLGLLVYWRLPELSLIAKRLKSPMIIELSVRDVVEAVGRGDFARTLLDRRNAVSHGIE